MVRVLPWAGSAGATLFLSGFVSLLGYTAISRELHVFFHGADLIYPVAAGCLFLCAALGASIGKPWPSEKRVASFFLLFAILMLAAFVSVRGAFLFAALGSADTSVMITRAAALAVSIAPASIISGMMFAENASMHAEKRGTPEGSYATWTAGGAAGALTAYAAIRYDCGNLSIILLSILASSGVALLHFQNTRKGYGRIAATGLIVAALALLYRAPALDMRMTGWGHPGLFVAEDLPAGRLAAASQNGEISVFDNGNPLFTGMQFKGAMFAHLAALQHPEPRRILETGGGWDGTVKALLQHKPARIDVILPPGDPLIRFRMPSFIRKSLANPTVHLSHAHPWRFSLQRGFAWDVILVNIHAPLSGWANRYYTSAFFRSLSGRLYRGGIVAVRFPAMNLPGTEHHSIPTEAVYRAISSVFPEIFIIPWPTTLILASTAPLTHSPDILMDRIRERGIEPGDVGLASFDMASLSDRATTERYESRLKAAVFPVHADTHPPCYTYSALASVRRLLPPFLLNRLPDLETIQRNMFTLGAFAGLALLLFFSGSRLRPKWQRITLATFGGFFGMTNQTALTLCYASKEANLYQQLPLLLAAFSVGLSLGSPIFRDLSAKRSEGRLWNAALLVGCMVFNAALIGVVKSSAVSLPLMIFLSTAAGFLTGGLLAGANTLKTSNRTKGSSLFTAHMLGGAAGALLAGMLFIPVFGFVATSMALIIAASLAFVLA